MRAIGVAFSALALCCALAVVAVLIAACVVLADRPCRALCASTPLGDVRARFEVDGFVVVRDVFAPAQLLAARSEIEAFHSSGGAASVVDFVGRGVLPLTAALRDAPALHRVLREVFGDHNYRYCSHNDV
eukprot:6277875-Prymnesium_polylepis.1